MTKKVKKFTQAPLPFQGQKRRFLKQFKEALKGFKTDAIYVDLFGGSGLLAHTVKQQYPDARVVWNDYDNYAARLEAIPETNMLFAELRPLVQGLSKNERLPLTLRSTVLDVVKRHENLHGYVDYVSLSASLLFSGKYATNFSEFEKETFYNCVRLADFDATGYLDGVERVQGDYRKLYDQHQQANVVFLVDPPYLSTDTKTYKSKSYWRLRDYLDVLNVLDDSNYFYFTSNKSQIVELCEWIETRTHVGNPFAGANINTTGGSVNYNSGYTDIMLYKNIESPN